MKILALFCGYFVLTLFFCSPLFATQVRVHVTDAGGAPLQDALVIFQDLRPQVHELTRRLTNSDGTVPVQDLQPGLYRAIATYPYSHWKSAAREFLVGDTSQTVELRLARQGTDDPVIVVVGKLMVHVLDEDGKPAVGATVLIRDAVADPLSERRGTTDAAGTVTLDLTDHADVLVVLYRDRLWTFPANGFDTERTVRLK